jgi:alkyldihydroxyacetonephosphate synthase
MITPEVIHELKALLGDDAIYTSADEINRHSYDAWPLAVKWRQQGKQPYAPEIIVYPKSTEQVRLALVTAAAHGVPVSPWGAGSSVTGAPLPLNGGITLNLSKLDRILSVDPMNGLVTVEAGVMGDRLEAELNPQGWTLNHSPQSLNRSTVGGWVATRAIGQFSSRYGGIEDLVISLKVVLANGEIIETKAVPRAATGPNLIDWFIGAEGTLGVVTEVILRIFPLSAYRRLEAVQFSDISSGLSVMRSLMQGGVRPFLVRFYDEDESRHALKDPSFTGCVMFLGFEGIQAIADAEYDAAMAMCLHEHGECLGTAPVDAWMKRRFDFSGVENVLTQTGGYAETIEVAHFWTGIQPIYTALKQALIPLSDEVLGHFSHVYTHGTSLYIILLGNADDDAQAEQRIRQFWETAMTICLAHGGALSHHHGVGIARLPYIEQELGETHEVMKRVKHALDPHHILSSGKMGL